MPIQKTEAILLKKQDLRETSLILTFYTKDFGKIKGIVRGVRGTRGQHIGGGALEIFAHDEIVFYERRKAGIYTVSQCDLIDFFSPIRGSLEKLTHALYLTELLDSVTSVPDKDRVIFELLLDCLKLLSADASPKRVARIFEIKLLDFIGMMPALTNCASCGGAIDPGARFSFAHGGMACKRCAAAAGGTVPILAGTVKFMEYVRGSPFEKAARIKVAAKVGEELEAILRKFLDFHIERRLNTVKFLKEIAR